MIGAVIANIWINERRVLLEQHASYLFRRCVYQRSTKRESVHGWNSILQSIALDSAPSIIWVLPGSNIAMLLRNDCALVLAILVNAAYGVLFAAANDCGYNVKCLMTRKFSKSRDDLAHRPVNWVNQANWMCTSCRTPTMMSVGWKLSINTSTEVNVVDWFLKFWYKRSSANCFSPQWYSTRCGTIHPRFRDSCTGGECWPAFYLRGDGLFLALVDATNSRNAADSSTTSQWR